MKEPRFAVYADDECTLFEIRNGDDNACYVSEYPVLMDWLEDNFGPEWDYMKDSDGNHPPNPTYEILPFHVKFHGASTNPAMVFRLRWC
jgi:hypothetical protein